MRCTLCQHENSDAARFCENCGGSTQRKCGACDAPLPTTANFCAQCGLPAAAGRTQASFDPGPAAQPDAEADGERRQLTVVFCDLVGSTALGQRLDLEDLREVLNVYQGACSRAVKRFDGHVAQYLGDGVLVYFGYPQAHEDDAERAVRAALEIQDSLRELNRNRDDGRAPIEARIGVHSGLVVVSGMGADAQRQPLALGDTINVSARIQEAAPAGAVVISDTTLRLVAGLFVTRSLGTPDLKGIGEPLGIHRVERGAGVGGRLRIAMRNTPIIGREQELGQFRDRWEQVGDGYGQVLAISGDAGIGKSRLLNGYKELLVDLPHSAFELSCSPYFAGSAFQPLIELYEQGFSFQVEESPDERLAKLIDGLSAMASLDLEDVVPYLGALLGLPASERFPLPNMSPEVQREKTFDALMQPLLAIESLQPVVVFCEDLHWCDPSTLELLGRLIDQTPTIRMLMVLTYRPEFEPPWPLARSYVSPLNLSRLPHRHTREVIAAATGRVRLPEPLMEQIALRADGVPLFAEELARSVVDSGLVVEADGRYEFRGRISDLEIPTTLQGSLMARLDRLSAAKRVAQLAAMLGREFSYPFIEAVADDDPAALRHGLQRLVSNEILYQRGTPPDSVYTFKHALLQDTAYESLLRSRRRELHARIASSLEERFPERVASEPEVMAHHCARGGLVSQAITHYERAGQQAIDRLAKPEAVEYFGLALDILTTQPESEERNLQEIDLRLTLSGPLASLRGYDDPAASASSVRIEHLCEQLSAGPTRLSALVGLSIYNQLRGDIPRAARFARQLLEVVDPLGIAPLQVVANTILGSADITSGTVPEACDHFDRASDLANETELPPPVAAYDLDVRFIVASVRAIALVLAGRPDASREMMDQSLSRAREVDHVYTLVSGLSAAATTGYFLDDLEGTGRFAKECLQILRGLGFHQPESTALVFGGWSRACRGEVAGIDDVERGIELATSTGALGGIAQLHLTAAEAFGRVGDISRADHFLQLAERIIDRTGERTAFAPQLPMFRANLILDSKSGTLEEAEALLLESLDLWAVYRSPWMELRSAILLGRVALERDDAGSAREHLERLLGRIEGGLDTPRVRLAQAVLARLS